MILTRTLVAAVALAALSGLLALAPSLAETITFVVIDKYQDPLSAKESAELGKLKEVIASTTDEKELQRATSRRDAILKSHEANSPIRLLGVEIHAGTNAPPTPVAVRIRAGLAKQVSVGDPIFFVPKGRPAMEGGIPTHRVARLEEKQGLQFPVGPVELRGTQGCPIPWRTAGRKVSMEVDEIEAGRGVGYSHYVSFRVRNASGFPVIGVVHITLSTRKGAEVQQYRFLLVEPLGDKREVDLMSYLPRDYSATDLVATVDAACVFESVANGGP